MRVGLTGASGYVGSWVVHELLSRGLTVHATVRDPSRKDKVGHLLGMAEALPGELVLFAADLLEPGSFREAFRGCEVVFHTASPFALTGIDDPQTALIDPALQGTRHVLADVDATESVTRVVLTSSVLAIYGDARECADRGGVLDESHWNETSRLEHQPYSLSKTVAEREAWSIAEAQDRWRLVVINPGFVMGPSLSKRVDGTSVQFMIDMATGKLTWMWDLVSPWVDVRDVAAAHAEAGLRDDAEGRHILSGTERSLLDLGRQIESDHPGRFQPAKWWVPKPMAYLVGPFMGFSWEYIRANVGHPLAMDRSKSEDKLGITYTDLRKTVNDHLEQLVRDGLIEG